MLSYIWFEVEPQLNRVPKHLKGSLHTEKQAGKPRERETKKTRNPDEGKPTRRVTKRKAHQQYRMSRGICAKRQGHQEREAQRNGHRENGTPTRRELEIMESRNMTSPNDGEPRQNKLKKQGNQYSYIQDGSEPRAR